MKKLFITLCAAIGLAFSGCTPDENTLVAAANSAGTIGMLTWFSIDSPDPQVKATLKEVITYVDGASVKVSEGETYLNSLLPYIQKFVLEQKTLNDYQKQLINAGSVVVLNGIDTFMAANPKVKANAELVNKVVGAFCKGCLAVLNMPEDCPECQKAREVYQMRNMKCRGGKFVIEK
jgi:hypothetical protein